MGVLRINQNPVAINSLRNLKVTGMEIAKTLEKLSSGLRINRAADDAAGLSISEKLRGQIRGLNRASANALVITSSELLIKLSLSIFLPYKV